MAIRIDITDAVRSLGRLEDVLRQPRPFLELIAEELFRVARVSFQKQSSPEGVPWKPLSMRYGAWKARRFPGRGILRLRGQLVRSLRRGVEGNIAFATAGPLAHAAVHQYGIDQSVNVRGHRRVVKSRNVFGKLEGKRQKIASGIGFVKPFSRRMRIPARPYLGFPRDSQERVARDIADLAKQTFDGKAR